MSGEGVRERLGKLRILNAHTRSCRPWVVMTGCATAPSHKALNSRAELVAPVPVHVMRLLRRCQTHMRECTVPGQQARPHVMPSSRPAGQRRPPLPPPAGERWPVALAADPPGHATHKTYNARRAPRRPRSRAAQYESQRPRTHVSRDCICVPRITAYRARRALRRPRSRAAQHESQRPRTHVSLSRGGSSGVDGGIAKK